MAKGWLLGLALCVCAGCGAESGSQGGRDTPQGLQQHTRPAVTFALRGRSASAMALTMTPVYREEPRFLSETKQFELLLVITDDANGRVRGAIASGSSPGLPISEVSGTLSRNHLQLTVGDIALAPGTSVALRTLELSGASATGSASGFVRAMAGDVMDQLEFTAPIAVKMDTEGRAASFVSPDSRPKGELLPADALELRIGEPVDARKLAAIRVLADGTPLAGALEMPSPVAGLANSARFTPRGLLPPGATLTIDVAGLTDTAGHPIAWDGSPLTTAPDTGPLTGNPSFERGRRGWHATGEVAISGSFEGVVPADGSSQAIVPQGSSLSGYLDVRAGATELSMSLAVFSEAGVLDAGRSVVVTLTSEDGTRAVVFDGASERQQGARGTFGEYGHRIGPRLLRVDLKPYRGQRVTLTADVRASGYFGVNYFALVLDDVRVR